MAAHLLETLSWIEAERVLNADTVVVIPLGSAAKEHGPHLPLNNDWLMAEYLKQRLLNEELSQVVVAPTVGYHFYPAFVDYPGSISLRLETACHLIVDICTSLAAFGPRKFYVINTGVSTKRPLSLALEQLREQEIILKYTHLEDALENCDVNLEQEGGSHADEAETSMMLYMAPEVVHMGKAVKDYHLGQGPLTRRPDGNGVYSASGVWGDATRANPEKGRALTEALFATILDDIIALSQTP